MDYCTIEDIETQTSTPTLIQLTSDDGQEIVDRVVAQEAILYSTSAHQWILERSILSSPQYPFSFASHSCN